MRRHRLKTLFESEAIKLESFLCFGEACSSRHEEMAVGHEIVIPTRGVFLRRDGSGEVFADVTRAVFFDPARPYEIDHPSGHPDGCYIFSPSARLLAESRQTYPEWAVADGDFSFRHASLPIDAGDCLAIGDLLAYFRRFGESEPIGAEEATVALLARFAGKAEAAAGDGSDSGPLKLNRRQRCLGRDIRVYLNENFRDIVRLDDIGKDLGSSTFHMCRIFRAGTGQTINQYLTRLRLNHSLDLLADTQPTITAIAYELGFSSHSHFTSRFRDYFGVTPTEARLRLSA